MRSGASTFSLRLSHTAAGAARLPLAPAGASCAREPSYSRNVCFKPVAFAGSCTPNKFSNR
jgi:hypothetical protein